MTWIAPAEKDAATQSLEKRLREAADQCFTSTLLKELLKKVSEIPASLDYDATGRFDFVLANLVRLYRGGDLDYTLGGEESQARLREVFGTGRSSLDTCHHRDVPDLCKAATLEGIEAQGWSLNPGRYVGVAAGEAVSDEDFKEQLETLNEELETLNAQARPLETTIASSVAEIIET